MMVVELGEAGKTMKMSKEEKGWQAEGDLSVLMQAKKIKADKARYAAAVALGRERLDGLMKIVGDDDAAEEKS